MYEIVSQPVANLHCWIFKYLRGYIYKKCMFYIRKSISFLLLFIESLDSSPVHQASQIE